MAESTFVRCNLCGADDFSVIAETQRDIRTASRVFRFDVRLACCRRCGLVYWNPRKSSQELQEYYEAVYRAPVVLQNVDEARRRTIQSRVGLLREHVSGGRLLEIGAGEGFFLQRASEAGFDVYGIEPSPSYAQVAARLVGPERVAEAFLETYQPSQLFDIVCSSFVIEHASDASDFLSRCRALLADDGWLYVEVPDIGLYPSHAADLIWHEYAYHFSQKTIRRLLHKAGFEAVRFVSPGPSYTFGMTVLARCRPGLPTAVESDPDEPAYAQRCFREHAARCAHYGQALRVDVALVIDDNPRKWGTHTSAGLLIGSPEQLKDGQPRVILVASDCFQDKMAANVGQWSATWGGALAVFMPHAAALAAIEREGPPQ